jgi:type II secretory pathway pseudopilin PulG
VTLVELIITIAITGVAITAIVWGMMTSITVSGVHRREATADTLARDAAEAVIDAQQPYSPAGNYTLPAAPSGYSVSIQTPIEFCTVASTAATFTSNCSSSNPDTGVQRITIVARSTDGQATETVQVLKRRI